MSLASRELPPNRRTLQVCILTDRQPAMLADALASLHGQIGLQALGITLRLLVVDVDPLRSGHATYTLFARPTAGLTCRYVHAAGSGPAGAHNRALEESQGVDLVAFLNDDEVAAPAWLMSLVMVMDRFDADVVSGPVLPMLQDMPGWITRGFVSQGGRDSGDPVRCAATNNVLLGPCVFRNFRFEDRLAHSDADDTYFFLRVHEAGLHMVWAAEASVAAWVPPERANTRWLMRHAYRDARGFTEARLLLTGGATGTRVSRTIHAVAGVVGAVALLARVPFGRRHGARAMQLMARSAGTLSAVGGTRHQAHGSLNQERGECR